MIGWFSWAALHDFISRLCSVFILGFSKYHISSTIKFYLGGVVLKHQSPWLFWSCDSVPECVALDKTLGTTWVWLWQQELKLNDAHGFWGLQGCECIHHCGGPTGQQLAGTSWQGSNVLTVGRRKEEAGDCEDHSGSPIVLAVGHREFCLCLAWWSPTCRVSERIFLNCWSCPHS